MFYRLLSFVFYEGRCFISVGSGRGIYYHCDTAGAKMGGVYGTSPVFPRRWVLASDVHDFAQ